MNLRCSAVRRSARYDQRPRITPSDPPRTAECAAPYLAWPGRARLPAGEAPAARPSVSRQIPGYSEIVARSGAHCTTAWRGPGSHGRTPSRLRARRPSDPPPCSPVPSSRSRTSFTWRYPRRCPTPASPPRRRSAEPRRRPGHPYSGSVTTPNPTPTGSASTAPGHDRDALLAPMRAARVARGYRSPRNTCDATDRSEGSVNDRRLGLAEMVPTDMISDWCAVVWWSTPRPGPAGDARSVSTGSRFPRCDCRPPS